MNRNFKRFWKAYNEYTKSDRNAIVVLSSLILITICATIIVKNLNPKTEYNLSGYEELLNSWENQKFDKKGKSLFAFNPNTVTSETLDSIDLPVNIKRNLLNYRKAGGKFYKTDQVRKIYGMNDSIFNVIEKYLIIPDDMEIESQYRKGTSAGFSENANQFVYEEVFDTETDIQSVGISTSAFTKIELNTADSSDLVKLNGVGPVFANRILKYRNLLGGFHSTQQLLEVYNFPVETFQKVENNVFADTLLLKKIRLNFAEYADLIRHPYLNKNQVEAILKFREKNGAFHEPEQLKTNGLLDNDTFSKLKPYLTCR